MRVLTYISTILFLFTLSWNGNFIVSDVIRPYVITTTLFIAISFINIVITGKICNKLTRGEDILLLYFIVALLVLSIFAPDSNFNYITSYVFVFVFYASILTNRYCIESQYGLDILRINAYVAVGSIFLLLLIYFLKVYYLIDLSEILPRLKDRQQAIYMGMPRNYGLSTEPGALSFYVETILLYGAYYFITHISRSAMLSWLVGIFFVVLLVTTFSAGAFASISLSIMLYGLLTIRQRSIGINTLFFITFLLFILVFFYATNFTGDIIEKVTLGETHSSSGRLEKWMLALNILPNSILTGVGLGQTTVIYEGSFLSYFVTLIVETGIIPTLIMLVYFLLSYVRILSSRCDKFILIPLGAGMIHLSVISTIYYPYVFVLIALARFSSIRKL